MFEGEDCLVAGYLSGFDDLHAQFLFLEVI
jgi:hypothetical protein